MSGPSQSTSPGLPPWPPPSPPPSRSSSPPAPLLRLHPHLRPAVSRCSRRLLSLRHRPIVAPSADLPLSPPLRSLLLSVADPSAPLRHGVDESYSLRIPSSAGTARLHSRTVWGAMRGLETLLQLSWVRDRDAVLVVAAGVRVSDAPLFPHRGVLLDTSRNYYPVRDLLRTVDAMAANKLNVFHWHLTDAQSFPLELPSAPELAERGSYGPAMRYTPSDVAAVVDYAMSHGVRVVPEIDTPGHTGSWTEAYPDIITCANMFWADGLAAEPGTGQLNPLKPQTYHVVGSVIRDVVSLFPENFYHAGADEINPNCWKTDPTIQDFLAEGGTLGQALEIFVNKTHPLIVSLNRTAVYWEDVLLSPSVKVAPSAVPTETTILQTWNNGPNNTRLLVRAGYRVIVSSADFYYLDCGHGGWVGNDSRYDRSGSDTGTDGGSWCDPFKTWQRVYDYDITYGLGDEEARLVLGGEVALWSEQSDPTVLDARLWPRASAMAEALWSGNRDGSGRKRYAEATDRLMDWRERMVGRGINAEPMQPRWCRTHPGMCNLVQ
ncbi:putative beta-hexosaminidase 2 [Iris pallida]|uniref:Beta-hexosaminidase n=1 Tax=Iris pallida TaxID=29817 RepID=A0AAX6HB59_IRIPA|nr:putative beta-hexosaminidase 2 [Iris pallida]